MLLAQGQAAGLVRADVGCDEVLALLTLATHGALREHWDTDLRRRATALMLDGIRA